MVLTLQWHNRIRISLLDICIRRRINFTPYDKKNINISAFQAILFIKDSCFDRVHLHGYTMSIVHQTNQALGPCMVKPKYEDVKTIVCAHWSMIEYIVLVVRLYCSSSWFSQAQLCRGSIAELACLL